MAGLPALQRSESGQVRKQAATAIYCKCRGLGSPPPTPNIALKHYLLRHYRAEAVNAFGVGIRCAAVCSKMA
jgi:hypothetical protein